MVFVLICFKLEYHFAVMKQHNDDLKFHLYLWIGRIKTHQSKSKESKTSSGWNIPSWDPSGKRL